MLRSSRLRWWLASGLPVAIAIGIGASIPWFFFRVSPLLLLECFVGGGLGTALAACIGPPKWVELRGTVLDAPGRGLRARLVAPVTAINPAATRRRSWLDRLSGEQSVRLFNGERAVLNHRWFRRGELHRLLSEVGCA